MQSNTWDKIIQAVSLLASMSSLALAVVAIWLSFKFYTMSVHSSERIEEANRAISASVDRLEKIFQMQYSDTFSMVRDTYSDFRKRILTDNASAEGSERIVESKADQKVEHLRAEIKSELSRVVDRIGQTDLALGTVRQQIEQVVDKAIVQSRGVDREARKETLRDLLQEYLTTTHTPNAILKVNDIFIFFRDRFTLADIARALFDLNQQGTIKLDTDIKDWYEISGNTKVVELNSA